MKFLQLLILMLLALTANAAKITDDNLILGASSVDPKSITFKDANATKMSVNYTTGAITFTSDEVKVGDGTDSDKNFVFDIGQGANNPAFIWDTAKQKLRQRIAGTVKDIGSGSGSGGGDNYNNAFTSEDNANAEDGTSNWTASAGTFGVITTDPLEGDQSFTWTPSAQNDEVCSQLLDFDRDILKGRSCEASIEYIGGDTSLDLLVVDGNGDILNPLFGTASTEGNNRTLPKHTITAKESVSFLCPSEADITADALNGDIKLCLKNVGATASPEIKWDKSYSGTNTGLSETTLPDQVSAKIAADGTILNDDYGILSGCTNPSGGNYTCSFNPGVFTETPKVTGCTVNQNDRYCSYTSLTTSSINFELRNNIGTLINEIFDFELTKKGADAKQTVQVYRSIPKVSENDNQFTVKVDSTGSLLTENFDALTVVRDSVGQYTVTFNEALNVAPSVQVSITKSAVETGGSGLSAYSVVHSLTNTGFSYKTGFENADTGDQGSLSDRPVSITVTKQGSDYKLPTTQQIVVGQVVNSYAENAQKNVRVESCEVDNTGTPVIAKPGLCNSWVESLTDNGAGNTDLNFKLGIFSGEVICNSTIKLSGNRDIEVNVDGSTSAKVTTWSSGSPSDERFSIICQGVR